MRRECQEYFHHHLLQRKPLVSDSRHASRHVHQARAMMHDGIANPRWRGKCSRHSRRMRNPQFYVSGKRSITTKEVCPIYPGTPHPCSHRCHEIIIVGHFTVAIMEDYNMVWYSMKLPEEGQFAFQALLAINGFPLQRWEGREIIWTVLI